MVILLIVNAEREADVVGEDFFGHAEAFFGHAHSWVQLGAYFPDNPRSSTLRSQQRCSGIHCQILIACPRCQFYHPYGEHFEHLGHERNLNGFVYLVVLSLKFLICNLSRCP